MSTLEILFYGFLLVCGLGIVTGLLHIWAAILQMRTNRRQPAPTQDNRP